MRLSDKNSCPYTFHVTDSENSQTIKETINRAKAKLNKKFISNSNLHTPKIIKTCPVPSSNQIFQLNMNNFYSLMFSSYFSR